MNYNEFKAKKMSQPNFGKDPAEWPKILCILTELKPAQQAEVIAAVLEAGEAGLVKSENALSFASLTSLKVDNSRSRDALPIMIKLIEHPEVADTDVKTIFSSKWMHSLSNRWDNEKDEWRFAFYNFPKHYASLFIEAINAKRPFANWRDVPLPTTSKAEKTLELKPLLLRVRKVWPTSGRSGYALLAKLREVDVIKALTHDQEISAALDNIEGHCDFGSLDKVKAILDEK